MNEPIKSDRHIEGFNKQGLLPIIDRFREDDFLMDKRKTNKKIDLFD